MKRLKFILYCVICRVCLCVWVSAHVYLRLSIFFTSTDENASVNFNRTWQTIRANLIFGFVCFFYLFIIRVYLYKQNVHIIIYVFFFEIN